MKNSNDTIWNRTSDGVRLKINPQFVPHNEQRLSVTSKQRSMLLLRNPQTRSFHILRGTSITEGEDRSNEFSSPEQQMGHRKARKQQQPSCNVAFLA